MQKATLEKHFYELNYALEHATKEKAIDISNNAIRFVSRLQNDLLQLGIIRQKKVLKRGRLVRYYLIKQLHMDLIEYEEKEKSTISYYLVKVLGMLKALLWILRKEYILLT